MRLFFNLYYFVVKTIYLFFAFRSVEGGEEREKNEYLRKKNNSLLSAIKRKGKKDEEKE